MTPDTDIVISVRGTRQYPIEEDFEKCIESLVKNTSNFRLVIVDDNSDAVAAEKVSRIASQFRDCIFIRTQFQHWFTRAYNLGLRMARTPWVVCLNADTVLDPEWLDELYAVRDEVNTSVGRVGLVGSVMSDPEPRRYQIAMKPDYVTAHCILVNMDALYDISAARGMPGIYLNETTQRAIHIHSDVDCSWEMNDKGWTTVKSFKSRVGHAGFKSWGGNLGAVNCVRLEDVAYKYGR